MNASSAIRTCLLFLLVAAAWAGSPPAVHALTQRDWAVALVDAMGRSYGLPDTPREEDYIRILRGERNLRLEAEETYSIDDSVSKMALPNFGPFSGSGWLLGISRPVDVHLRFTLPLDGHYRVTAAVRGPGYTLRIGDQIFQFGGPGGIFTTIELGEVALVAGPQEVVVTLPAGGALDFITLTAPPLEMIAPDQGWQPAAPLTWEVCLTTAVQALRLGHSLPLQEDARLALEAEELGEIGAARIVEDKHRGAPSGGLWVRTTVQAAELPIPLTIAKGGFFDLSLELIEGPVKVTINNQHELSATGKPYLQEIPVATIYLTTGSNLLTVTLPPRSGLDRILLKPRQSDPAALSNALGLAHAGDAPTATDLDRLSTRLVSAPR